MVSISLAGTPLFDRAASAYKTGEFAEAEKLCQQVVAARPNFFDAFLLLAQVQSRLGKINAALTTYDRVLDLWPNAARAHFNRGVLLEELKRYDDALASYNQALSSATTVRGGALKPREYSSPAGPVRRSFSKLSARS